MEQDYMPRLREYSNWLEEEERKGSQSNQLKYAQLKLYKLFPELSISEEKRREMLELEFFDDYVHKQCIFLKENEERIRKEYAGRFIAVYDGRVIDSDLDSSSLEGRIFTADRLNRETGDIKRPVLIRRIPIEGEEEIPTSPVILGMGPLS